MVKNQVVFVSHTRTSRCRRWSCVRLGAVSSKFFMHSYLQPLQKHAPRHPQIAQSKQRHQVSCFLETSLVLEPTDTELALDFTERARYIISDAGLDLLQFAQGDDHIPLTHGLLWLVSLRQALVAHISEHSGRLIIGQLATVHRIINIICRGPSRVYKSGIDAHDNVRSHDAASLNSLHGISHLRGKCTFISSLWNSAQPSNSLPLPRFHAGSYLFRRAWH
jgi:hypothetical protein